jgi:hypothetical protein
MIQMSRAKWDAVLLLFLFLIGELWFLTTATAETWTHLGGWKLAGALVIGPLVCLSILVSNQPAIVLDEHKIKTSIQLVYFNAYAHELQWSDITDIKLYWFGQVLFKTTDAPDRLKYFADLNLVNGSVQENYATIRQYWEKYR